MKFITIKDMFEAGGGAASYSSIISIDILTRDDIFKAGNDILLITDKMERLLDSYARENKTIDAEVFEQKVEFSLKHQIEMDTNKDQAIKKRLIRLKLKEEGEFIKSNEFLIHKGFVYISDKLYRYLLGNGCRFKHVKFEEAISPVILHEDNDTIANPVFAKDYDRRREVKMAFLAILIAVLAFAVIFRLSGVI